VVVAAAVAVAVAAAAHTHHSRAWNSDMVRVLRGG